MAKRFYSFAHANDYFDEFEVKMTDNIKADALLPCPFCGNIEGNHSGGVYYTKKSDTLKYVQCDSCGTKGPRSDFSEDAIAAWNIRAMQDAFEQVCEALEKVTSNDAETAFEGSGLVAQALTAAAPYRKGGV